MKGQRKEVNTATTHIAVRLKKGGAGKGQTRFEVLINRSAYPGAAAAKKKDTVWDMKEVVDEVFTNSAKLEPADKNLLDQCFPNKTKKEVILEILEKGEAQTSEVDRAHESAAQGEYYSQVAAAVTAVALMQEESDSAQSASAAPLLIPETTSSSKQTEEPSGKKGKKGGKDKDNKAEEQQPVPVVATTTTTSAKKAPAAAAAASAEPKYVHVSKEVVEREMKNARFKLIPGEKDKVSLDEQVNAAFLALAKNAVIIKIIRDQKIMVVDCEKQQDAQNTLHSLEEFAGKKPWKVLKTVNDKKGGQTITILFSADIKVDKITSKPGITVSVQKNTHVPTSEEDDLSRFVPVSANAVKVVASAPAVAAISTSKNNEEEKGGKDNNNKKGSGKKGNSKDDADNKGKAHNLEDELAALTKKGGGKKGGNDDDSGSSSSSGDSDEAPKMMVGKKGKKR